MLDIIINIAKKEFIDNIRNKWIIIITILFISLTLLASYAGSIYSEGWQDLGSTMSVMGGLVNFLITIIALILGYSAIIGEIEKGSMDSLLSLPAKRIEIILGKFFGLGIVLTFAILTGFGTAGIIIGFNVHNVNYVEYLIFIGATILVGLVFLSIGIFLSCLFRKRSTAMGSAILVFFLFTILWRFIVVALLFFINAFDIKNATLPDWYLALNFFNPINAYEILLSLNIPSLAMQQVEAITFGYTSFLNTTNVLIALILWLLTPLILACWVFKNKDI
ncbi:MAG: hypothetical protein DRM98_04930 [Thermoplasmata archaeon]|nr:MAG: hypothetical protein DRM98_04930 [Thermoplasmata archaeon]RLF53324.1 MAG: hypothetical protein DRN24_01250 [Thermoplasmata archaeon]